jgi:hypothetical protein
LFVHFGDALLNLIINIAAAKNRGNNRGIVFTRRIASADTAKSEQKQRQWKSPVFGGRVMTLAHHCYDQLSLVLAVYEGRVPGRGLEPLRISPPDPKSDL